MGTTFRDLGGNTREIRIDVRDGDRLKTNNGIDTDEFIGAGGEAKMYALLRDRLRFAGVLFTLTAKPGETEDEFYPLFDLPTLEAAAEPFMIAVVSFTQGPAAGAVLAAELAPQFVKIGEARAAAVERVAVKFGQTAGPSRENSRE